MYIRQTILWLTVGVNFHTCLRFGYTFYKYGSILPGFFTAFSLLVGLALLDVCRLQPARSHSPFSLLVQFAAQKLYISVGSILYIRLRKMSANVEKHQKDVLQRILNQNRNTLCAKSFGLSEVDSVSEFMSTVPLTRYTNYEKFVEILEENGTSDIFFPGKTDYIAFTSGTTSGENKKFPKSLKLLKRTMGKWLCISQTIFLQVPQNNYLRKWLTVKMKPKIFYTKSRIKCGPIYGLASDLSLNYHVMPSEIVLQSKEETVIYINLLFGLLEEEICNLFFPTSQVALQFFKMLERNWEQLCNDIESGKLSLKVGIPIEQRTCIEKHLCGGNRLRANLLRRELSFGLKGIVPRIWPTCACLFCPTTGSFFTQANIVKETYLGRVPIFSPFHAGTETVYGINIDLDQPEVTYLAMTAYNFLEFIPFSEINSECPRTLLAHEVEEGALYELVVTTYEGLYRYRTEDVIQVKGFYGTIPKYKFVCRAGDFLSVCTERVPEMLVSMAIISASSKWNRTLLEYTSTENINVENITGEITGTHYYIIFVELSLAKDSLTDQHKRMVDEELRQLHEFYAMYRASGRMQSVRIVEVENGTFDGFRQLCLSLNPNISGMQYKISRIVRKPEYLKFLIKQAIDGVRWNTEDKTECLEL